MKFLILPLVFLTIAHSAFAQGSRSSSDKTPTQTELDNLQSRANALSINLKVKDCDEVGLEVLLIAVGAYGQLLNNKTDESSKLASDLKNGIELSTSVYSNVTYDQNNNKVYKHILSEDGIQRDIIAERDRVLIDGIRWASHSEGEKVPLSLFAFFQLNHPDVSDQKYKSTIRASGLIHLSN